MPNSTAISIEIGIMIMIVVTLSKNAEIIPVAKKEIAKFL